MNRDYKSILKMILESEKPAIEKRQQPNKKRPYIKRYFNFELPEGVKMLKEKVSEHVTVERWDSNSKLDQVLQGVALVFIDNPLIPFVVEVKHEGMISNNLTVKIMLDHFVFRESILDFRQDVYTLIRRISDDVHFEYMRYLGAS